jgi:hypothetical protein
VVRVESVCTCDDMVAERGVVDISVCCVIVWCEQYLGTHLKSGLNRLSIQFRSLGSAATAPDKGVPGCVVDGLVMPTKPCGVACQCFAI